jgi:hypothetical protein
VAGAAPARDVSTFETGSARQRKRETEHNKEQSELRNEWVRASPGAARDKIWERIKRHNRDNPDDPITQGDLRKSEKRWKKRREEALEEID